MTNEEIARTQIEISYLYAKMERLIGADLASQAMARWLDTTVEDLESLVKFCSGVKLPSHTAAYMYKDLGFTYVEISKFVGRSTPTIVQYLREKEPKVLTGAEKTPYDIETWEQIRHSLDSKKQEMLIFGFRAKESII